MKIRDIIRGLRFTAGMVCLNPITGDVISPEELNENDLLTYDSCMNAAQILENIMPRVMTSEEAHNWLSTEKMFRDPVWFEVKDGIVACVATDIIFKPKHWDSFKDEYGKTWRCWAGSRPSEELRNEVKWNG